MTSNYIMIDTEIFTKKPYKSLDHISGLVNSLVYPPIVSDLILKKVAFDNEALILYFSDYLLNIKWFNIKHDVINLFKFWISNEGFVSDGLSSVFGYPNIEEAICVSENSVSIKTFIPERLIEILSNPQYGVFKIIESKIYGLGLYKWNSLSLEKSSNYYDFIPEKIDLIINDDIHEQANIFKKHHNIISCPTFYMYENIDDKTYVEKNDLRMYFSLKEIYLKNLIKKIKLEPYLEEGLNLNKEITLSKLISKPEKKIKILLADYYPNDIIVDSLCTLLRENNIDYELSKLKFRNFLKENKKIEKYDIVFNIFKEKSNNIFDEMELHMSYIKNQEEFANVCNSYLEGRTSEDSVRIYIEKHSLLILVAGCNNIYKKKGELSLFNYTKKGSFSYEFLNPYIIENCSNQSII